MENKIRKQQYLSCERQLKKISQKGCKLALLFKIYDVPQKQNISFNIDPGGVCGLDVSPEFRKSGKGIL